MNRPEGLRNVKFANSLPSEGEFFEEYDKYNASFWFFLIFILRCLCPLCISLQTSLFKLPEALDLYIQRFSISTNDSHGFFFTSNCFSHMHKNGTLHLTLDQETEICIKKDIILGMTLLKSIGTCSGALLGGILSDIFGRRIVSLYSSVLFNLLSWIVIGVEDKKSIEVMHIFILAAGIMMDAITFVIFGEICNKKNRILGIYVYSFSVLGEVMMQGLSKTLTVWKFLLAFLASMNTLVVYSCWYLPESPRWLFTFNKKREVYDHLNSISGVIYEPESSFEDPNHKKKDVIRAMAKFLFWKKFKNFIIICFSTSIACLIYNCAKIKSVHKLIELQGTGWMASTAEIMGYLFLLPIYIFLGKRCGICFIFLLISVQSLVAFFVLDYGDDIYFSIFSIMFGTAALGLNWLYFLDIFPTFLRGTTFGCSFFIDGLMAAVSAFITDKFSDFYKLGYHLLFFFGSLFGTIILILPETANQDLPNFKPFE